MTYGEWLALGQEAGWVSDGWCWTHDGLPPVTAEERDRFDRGYDPCVPVFRVWLGLSSQLT